MSDSTLTFPMPHPATLPEEKLLAECRLWKGRRRGPGGQHRNKVETAIVIEHQPSGVRAEAAQRRSGIENRRAAIRRLRLKLALCVRCPQAAKTAPSQTWQARSRGGRIAINPRHWDFPALLAEAIDVVMLHRADLGAASQQLGTTTSQLVKLLKLWPAALEYVNRQRVAAGLRPFK